MDFSVYSRPRRFQLPYLQITRTIGPDALLWAMITGPFYFWKKGAMIEGLAIAAATVPLWAVETDNFLLDSLSGLVWIGAALLAPVLVAMSYERRGWVDVTDRRRLDRDEIDSLDAWSREAALANDAEDDIGRASRRQLDDRETAPGTSEP